MSKTIIKIVTVAVYMLCLGLGYLIGAFVEDDKPSFIRGGAIGPMVHDTVVVHDTVNFKDDLIKHYWYWYKSITFPGHGGTFNGYVLFRKGDTVTNEEGEVLIVVSEGHLLKN